MSEAMPDGAAVTCVQGGKLHAVVLNLPTRSGFIQECRDCGKEINGGAVTYERIVYPQGYTETKRL